MKILKSVLTFSICALLSSNAFSFCGFYVAKADADLFNKASEVILVRDGNRSVITMSNDFSGDVKDFAMVVPVPVVLKEKDIKVVERYIFDKLDAYSGPRLVEYHDPNPCQRYLYESRALKSMSAAPTAEMDMAVMDDGSNLGVTIEAQYTVGEYDILILSAQESDGLEKWLTINGYKIPKSANEVLQPYIKSNMKFFVVKVDLEQMESDEDFTQLRPLQISFNSDKFMLPIRLGMANSIDHQDMVVYAFTKTGRIETTNYRTTKIPTNEEIPSFIKDEFGKFYSDVFEKAWAKYNTRTVFLEYAWNLSSNNFVKCDPCATTPPSYAELNDAGVFWADQNFERRWGGADYSGDVYFTRLHLRYNRDNFPQDLNFQVTPNKENFQGRYVINNPARGTIDCDGADKYFRKVIDRREKELYNLARLTGWDISVHDDYADEFKDRLNKGRGWLENGKVIRGSFIDNVLSLNAQSGFLIFLTLIGSFLIIGIKLD